MTKTHAWAVRAEEILRTGMHMGKEVEEEMEKMSED